MTERDVHVIRTGSANLASILVGLERLGARTIVTHDAASVRDAERVVLPGVGHFAPAREMLDRYGLASVLQERVAAGRPTLAICLGLQLLGSGSDESPGTSGLGIIPSHAHRFPETVTVPQLGWNAIEADDDAQILASGHVYFANTFRLVDAPEGWSVARADHGGSFIAAVERGAVVGCQFHPELSGALGADILKRWLTKEPTC